MKNDKEAKQVEERCSHCPHLVEGDGGEWVCDLEGMLCRMVASCKEWDGREGELF